MSDDNLIWAGLVRDGWRIVGLNHYEQRGQLNLFVAMTKDGRCIKAEGPDSVTVWNNLYAAAAIEAQTSEADE